MKCAPPGMRLRNIASTALLLIAAGAAYLLATYYPAQRDLTQNARNSLDPGSVQVLQAMAGPVQLTVFTTQLDAKQGDIRQWVRAFVARYQRYKADIALAFVDPVQHPDEARKAEIQANGEMTVEYAGRREHLTTLSEQALTSALLKLAHRQEQLVMYVTGHGERKLDGIGNHDLGEFGKRLAQLGFQISGLSLSLAQDVPANASLLVITHPQTDWLPGEVDKLMRYVDSGGNLLWLLDAEPLRGLQPLAERLGLALKPGLVIDPDAAEARAPLTWSLASDYPPHAITRKFELMTAFPFARPVSGGENAAWQYRTLVNVAPRGWVSTRPPKDASIAPRFYPERDVRGPVAIAAALRRAVQGHEQRMVVVGSGAFLANTYAGNGGNMDLGVNMVNWLSNQDRLITILPRAAQDHTLTLSKTQLDFIGIGLVIALPLVLALAGSALWWRRRR